MNDVTIYALGVTVEVIERVPTPPPAPTISNLTVTPNPVLAGQSVTVDAVVTDATSVTLGGVPVSLPYTFAPPGVSSWTSTLVAAGPGGTAQAPVNIVIKSPVSQSKIPVLGTARMHHQENWMADWIDPILKIGRALPWDLGADIANGVLARSKNGVASTVQQAWPIYGNMTELYSEFPWFDPQGRSHPYNPETSDDISIINADFKVRPPKDGARGINMLISQCTIIPHPTFFPAIDSTINKTPNTGIIPRHPLALWLRHDALLIFCYADGMVVHIGWIPGILNCQDACIDGRFNTVPSSRKIMYVCDMGTKDANGKWVGGRVARVDRTPGAVAIGGTPQEDPTKYVVTTFAPAGFPSAVRSDENGNVYFIDMDRAGEITMVPFGGVPVPLVTVPNAFAMDYAAGKLYVMCSTSEVRIVDIASKTVSVNLMPNTDGITITAPAARNADFFTISVDANGTCGPVGTFMCSRVHTHGNTNSWQFTPGGASVKYGNAIYKSGQNWMTGGRADQIHELFGHYDWLGGKYHIDQAVQFVGGYANVPPGIIVHDPEIAPGVKAPTQAVVDYTAVWRGIANICNGGTLTPNLARPSLTCLMTREGWSPFKGCSNDELAELPFDDLENTIHNGYIGSFRRDDIVGTDLYCLMLHHCVNSKRHIREGAMFITSFNNWWKSKGRTIPAAPAAVVNPNIGRPKVTTHVDGNQIDYRLEVRETSPGQYRIGMFGSASEDIRYKSNAAGRETTMAIPSDAVIVVDEGMPTEQIGTAGLTPGWHAFTVRAAGWCTGAVSYMVP